MSEEMSSVERENTLVCVTGASGFIGTHVVRVLLERGYHVRGTVRDATNEAKVAHLKELATGLPGTLELFSANLTDPGSFDAPIAGCTFVCHVASAVYFTADDPQTEIVDVAVDGTKNVLSAIAKAGTVKRVALTSSVAAAYYDEQSSEYVYTEDDWSTTATVDKAPYPLSKVEAEKAAWAFQREMPTEQAFALVTILPGLVLGPVYTAVHARSSPTIIKDLMAGKFPACPRLSFGCVDVREVADAHVTALEDESTQGRYLLFDRGLWMSEMAATIRESFPHSKAPKGNFPNWMMYVFALFDKRLTFGYLRQNLGVMKHVDGSKATRELGIEYRPLTESIQDTCCSLIEIGLVPGEEKA